MLPNESLMDLEMFAQRPNWLSMPVQASSMQCNAMQFPRLLAALISVCLCVFRAIETSRNKRTSTQFQSRAQNRQDSLGFD